MSKTIIKQLYIITLVFLSLFLFNCQNNLPFQNSEKDKHLPAGYGSTSLMISSWLDEMSSRTVFPPRPSFSSYEYFFTPKSGQQQPEFDTTSEFPSLVDIDLEEGEWEIKVYGRIEFNDQEKRIAEGSSTVKVIASKDIEVFITIRSRSLEKIEGILNWKLPVPDDIEAGFWKLTLSDWPEDKTVLIKEGIVSSGEIEDFVFYESGYYLLRISIGNQKQEVSYFSVVHIRGYETTFYERQVKLNEFVPVINISGSVDLSSIRLDGGPVKVNERPDVFIKEIRAFSSAGNMVGVTDVNSSSEWLMRIAEPNEEIDLEFRVVLNIGTVELELKYDEKKKVYKNDLSVKIKIEKNMIRLSGTLTIYPDNYKNFPNWEIKAFTDEISSLALNNVYIKSDGKWEMIIEPFNTPTFVHFIAENTVDNKKYKRIFHNEKEVANEYITTTIDLKANFNPPTQVWLYGNNFSDSPYEPMIKYADRFIFTRKKDIISQEHYSFNIIANFGNVNNNPGQLSNPKYYNFDDVIKIINNNILTLYYNNEAFEWNNNELSELHLVDNIRITLVFSNDEYLDERMMPSIKIEKINEVYIPGGTFTMGSPASEDGRYGPTLFNNEKKSSEEQHSVSLSSFYMMSTEVTQLMYEELMPAPSYVNTGGFNFWKHDYPVVNISWFDAVEFSNKLSEKDRLEKVYSITGTGNNRSVSVNWDASGWRLPTEAEWEYAARAGSAEAFTVFRDETDNLLNQNGQIINSNLANYNALASKDNEYKQNPAKYIEHIIEVTSHYPNAWGLYNMHGNVWEFCWDWYGDYIKSVLLDPKGPTSGISNVSQAGPNNINYDASVINSQNKRIIRGGSYYTSARYLRSAHRGVISPHVDNYNDIGFRLVRNGNAFVQ